MEKSYLNRKLSLLTLSRDPFSSLCWNLVFFLMPVQQHSWYSLSWLFPFQNCNTNNSFSQLLQADSDLQVLLLTNIGWSGLFGYLNLQIHTFDCYFCKPIHFIVTFNAKFGNTKSVAKLRKTMFTVLCKVQHDILNKMKKHKQNSKFPLTIWPSTPSLLDPLFRSCQKPLLTMTKTFPLIYKVWSKTWSGHVIG